MSISDRPVLPPDLDALHLPLLRHGVVVLGGSGGDVVLGRTRTT
jgi:hypothetical protein